MKEPEEANMCDFKKQVLVVRYWFMGRCYYKALEALELGLKYHNGKRKGGQPEFSHQIAIVQYLRTIEYCLMYKEETFIVALLHDLMEDKDYSYQDLVRQFGEPTARRVLTLSKKYRGSVKDAEFYYNEIADDPVTSIVKGVDRIHNHQTMMDVFSHNKQMDYIDETKGLILPVVKTARRKFPSQEPAYENIKHVLKSQIELIYAIHDGKKNATRKPE